MQVSIALIRSAINALFFSRMWSHFVDCIRRYITDCFEENRRLLFHKSVEHSIDTVHAICSSRMYQTGE